MYVSVSILSSYFLDQQGLSFSIKSMLFMIPTKWETRGPVEQSKTSVKTQKFTVRMKHMKTDFGHRD